MVDKTGAWNVGAVASMRGSVANVNFDGHLPPISSLRDENIYKYGIEVMVHDAHHVRDIAPIPTRVICVGHRQCTATALRKHLN